MEVSNTLEVGLTKNMTELCVLLIDDKFGELPSRIFATLLSKGRSTSAQLKKHTSLSPKQLRHGLAVLIQQNLLYFYVDDKVLSTFYEANSAAAYGLVRTGKISGLVEGRYGSAARDVVQSLLSLGHTRVADLRAAYRGKIRSRGKSAIANGADAAADGDPFVSDEDGMPVDAGPSDVKSMEHLDDVLVQLLRADVVEVVSPQAFCSPADRSRDAQEDIKRKHFPNDPRGAKQREEYDQMVAHELRELRDLPKKLKRPLVGTGGGRRPKARKLFQSDVSNGVHDDDGDVASLDANSVLRVNQERCMVELRNQTLVRIASGAIGETTGHVYAVLLRLLTDPIPRCRLDPVIDGEELVSGRLVGQQPVSTANIFDHLNPSLDVAAGIGNTASKLIDVPTAEKIRKNPPQASAPSVEVEGESSDEDVEDLEEEDDGYDDEAILGAASPRHANGTNGTKGPKVTFEDDSSSSQTRQQQMRQHLLLLCESRYGFVRHCGRGMWTVDFGLLLRRIQETELDKVIERQVGRPGLRLARVLRKHGKLDEKGLNKVVLMPKNPMQNHLLRMQVHGFVDVQEVPKDNSRTANRTLFLWYSDMERSLSQLLDNNYKAMLRCLQIRKRHQHKNSDVLTFVERPDVKGREKEALEGKYFNKYEQYRETEGRLLSQVMRLDELVAILRDY